MEQQEKRQSQSNQKKEELKQSSCPNCSTLLDISDSFCPECGTKIHQEVTICRNCETDSNGSYCENCGTNQISNSCKKCSTISLEDFCESCGEPLTEVAQGFLKNPETEEATEVLSPIEAEEILKEMESLMRPDVKRIQEKMRQRIILERERDYFQEREKRIQQTASGSHPKIQIFQQEDFQKIQNQMKTFSGYLDRQIQKKEEEEREIVRQKEEAEKKVLQQKKEEAARMAEEKRQKKANRVNGLWVSTSGMCQITLDLREAGSGMGKAYVNDLMMETVDILKVKWTGSRIEFHTTKIHVKWILPIWKRIKIRFTGHVSEDGEMMTGYISSAEYWQEVFIKN
jgi:RNA polymerase subunit RPABC4/transcription elongation factor Spt4